MTNANSRPDSNRAPSAHLTREQCFILWMEKTDAQEQVILNRLRDQVGPNGDVLAAYRRWHARQMEEHDRSLFRMMERMGQARARREMP